MLSSFQHRLFQNYVIVSEVRRMSKQVKWMYDRMTFSENLPFPPTKIQFNDSCSIMLRSEGCKSSFILKALKIFRGSRYCTNEVKVASLPDSAVRVLVAFYSGKRFGHFDTTSIPPFFQLSWCLALNRTNQKMGKKVMIPISRKWW